MLVEAFINQVVSQTVQVCPVTVSNDLASLEKQLAREALKVEHEHNLSMVVPVLVETLETLATWINSEAGERHLQTIGLKSEDIWLDSHPILRFLTEKTRQCSMHSEFGLYRLVAILERMGDL